MISVQLSYEEITFPDGGTTFIPTVHMGMLTWTTHHGIAVGQSDQVDGYITETRRSLDIWYADAPENDDLRSSYPEIPAEAAKAWSNGQVLVKGLWPHPGDENHKADNGIPSIILPGVAWTDDVIVEAFRRFIP